MGQQKSRTNNKSTLYQEINSNQKVPILWKMHVLHMQTNSLYRLHPAVFPLTEQGGGVIFAKSLLMVLLGVPCPLGRAFGNPFHQQRFAAGAPVCLVVHKHTHCFSADQGRDAERIFWRHRLMKDSLHQLIWKSSNICWISIAKTFGDIKYYTHTQNHRLIRILRRATFVHVPMFSSAWLERVRDSSHMCTGCSCAGEKNILNWNTA